MIHFLAPSGDADLPPDYIARAGFGDRASVITFEEVLERDSLPFGVYVFAGINRLGPAMAELLAGVYDRLHEATGIAPLNHPTRSRRRYELIRELNARGMIPYTAYGAWEDFSGVRLPAFVRPREADGGVPELKHSLAELEREIGTQIMQGRRPEEVIVVEFTDTSIDGEFTKYSVYRIGDRYLAKSVDRGTEWVLRRQSSEVTMDLVQEADEYQRTNPHGDQVREIFELARIEFGRIDYSMLDGRVICWEINTLPLLRRPAGVKDSPEDIRRAREYGKALFAEQFTKAFEALARRVDVAAESLSVTGTTIPPVAIAHDSDLLAAARKEVDTIGVTAHAGREPFAGLRLVLRPLKPVLRPIATVTLYPLLARMARR